MTPIRHSHVSPNECQEFASDLHRVLDREFPLARLSRAHVVDCLSCRALLSSAEVLISGLEQQCSAPPTVLLNERIVHAVIRDRRQRRIIKGISSGAALALAAAIVITIVFMKPWKIDSTDRDQARFQNETKSTFPIAQPKDSERVTDRVADAGTALSSISKKASNQALSPTRSLVTSRENLTFASADLPPGVEPAAESLSGMPEAAKSSLEPVTSGIRRAVNLFLRDTGLGNQRPRS